VRLRLGPQLVRECGEEAVGGGDGLGACFDDLGGVGGWGGVEVGVGRGGSWGDWVELKGVKW